jgi:hypothetical protein
MRVNFTARPSVSQHEGAQAVHLTIKPSCGVPGDFSFTTDCATLVRMLRQKTDLRLTAIEDFERELEAARSARLFRVEMSDSALTEIGYFVD